MSEFDWDEEKTVDLDSGDDDEDIFSIEPEEPYADDELDY